MTKLERKLAEQAIRDIDRYFAETGGEPVSTRDVKPRFVLIRGGKR